MCNVYMYLAICVVYVGGKIELSIKNLLKLWVLQTQTLRERRVK